MTVVALLMLSDVAGVANMQVDSKGNLLISADDGDVVVRDASGGSRSFSVHRAFGGMILTPRNAQPSLDPLSLYSHGGARLVRVSRDDNLSAVAWPLGGQTAAASPFSSGIRVWFDSGSGTGALSTASLPSCVVQLVDTLQGRWRPVTIVDVSATSIGIFSGALGVSVAAIAVVEPDGGTAMMLNCFLVL